MANLLTITRRSIKAGATFPPTLVPANLLVGLDTVTFTVTVDDPTVDPPTDAKVMITVEASEDAGITWRTISSSWGGTSGVMTATIPVRNRPLRISGHADLAATVDVVVA